MAKKKVFFDLEYTGLHKLTTPISIALVGEDGREYYAEFTDFDEMQVDGFIREAVLAKLELKRYDFVNDYNPNDTTVKVAGNTELIAQTLISWLDFYEKDGVEMWGDGISYDWVLFISIFGNAFDMPKHIQYLPMDLATALRLCRQDCDLDRVEFAYGKDADKSKVHNSLNDARTQLDVYKKILKIMGDAGNDSLGGEIQDAEVVEETQDGIKHAESTESIETIEPIEPIEKTSKTDDNFVEPTEEMINNLGEEFTPPI